MYHPLSYAGPVRIPPPQMQLRVRRETNAEDSINARQFEAWTSGVPTVQGGNINDGSNQMKPAFYDMAPLSSRTDKQDYRQSQPFVAKGPSLAMNPYFDRYDPTRDPRNMIREVRSVVYEEKEADRGLTESRRLSERVYLHRWLPEGSSSDDMKASLDAYEVMRPKQDNITEAYKAAPETVNASVLSTFNQM
jgi:hypothetical protein